MKDRYECSCGKLYQTLMAIKCKCKDVWDHANKETIHRGRTHDGTRIKKNKL